MSIANSTILIYRKDFSGKPTLQIAPAVGLQPCLNLTAGPLSKRPVRKEKCLDGKRSKYRIGTGVLANRYSFFEKVRLSGLPFLPALQRFPLQLLPKFQDQWKLSRNEHE
jgi:hypothetical protein